MISIPCILCDVRHTADHSEAHLRTDLRARYRTRIGRRNRELSRSRACPHAQRA